MKKKGVSPVIATVLLIAMVIVIALVIFLWFRNIGEETITKFGGTNVKLVCNDVSFEASYSGNVLSISNSGNVPIYNMKLKFVREGSHETKSLKDLTSNWPKSGLSQGGAFADTLSETPNSGEQMVLIPVLIGNSDKGKRTFTCEEYQGYEISI